MSVEIPFGAVGANVAKLESAEKLTGAAQYIADLSRPNMLHAAIVQSDVAHARILGYDLTAALAVPGVAAVLTGADFPDGRMGAFIKDEHAIAKDKIRYFGEPVAVVAAEDEETARAAAKLVVVDYEELPAILSPEAGLAPDAAIIHEELESYLKVFPAICDGNMASYTELSEGDIEVGFAEADVVVEGEFETAPQAHLAIEPVGALAEIDSQGRITLWSANQSVFRVQANVCESLNLPMSKLRCLTPRIGGGFGNKMEPHIQPLVVRLTQVTGRPVKLILNREEDFECVRARHPFKIRCRTGAKKDGTLVAREMDVLLDCGAFGDDSPGVLGYSLLMSRGPYRIPNVKCHGKLVYTNKIRFGAYRGFGNPQVSFAAEQQLDEIAAKLGMDPLDLREKNLLQPGDAWFGGGKVASNGLADCIAAARKASDWDSRTARPAPKGKRRGTGVALGAHISGLLGTGAIVRVLEDGSIVLNTGAVDIGQGSDTVLVQMCAEALKVPVEKISLASPDTDGSPYNWGTTASRVTYTTGRAVVGASKEVEKQLKDHAAQMLECAVGDLELRPGGMVGVTGSDKEVSFHQISLRAHWGAGGPIVGHHTLVFDQPTVDPKRAIAKGLPFPQIGVYSFICTVVDTLTDEVSGKTEVDEVWTGVDVGKAINPSLVIGQMDGGFVQGMGFALCEEMVWDGPKLANPTLLDYKVPTTLDAPYRMHTTIVDAPEPDGPFGAKGAGEIGLVPVPAAIANAIASAIGNRLHSLPMKPEKVFRAMTEHDDAA
ncbi:xanthine dehydrogenase family protein molybdopterin-binding subunit [Pacificispira sp.]|uniref:xanthine dehydrogenase family protein molybdopterin-binding subunit n=1 Tax=Pacificispira sp. TaxID=2888761 RepID=UPI003BAC25CC